MYDPTMHTRTLARQIIRADFMRDKGLYSTQYRLDVIEASVLLAESGFNSLDIMTNTLRGKNVYQLSNLSELLIIRHITQSVRRITKVKQDSLPFIIECMRSLFAEGVRLRTH